MAIPTRSYNFTNGSVADADQVDTEFNALFDYFTSGVEADALADADLLGLSGASTVRRGKKITATEETTTSASYTTLTTPDQVDDVVLATDGLIFIAFQALWKMSSAAGTGMAALFLGANQVKASVGAGAPTEQSATFPTGGADDTYKILASGSGGLRCGGTGTGGAESHVTTGQIIGQVGVSDSYSDHKGGIAVIYAAAGTYDVAVKFKRTSGTLSVKERKLWVWTQAF